jgi:hypothetical protein
MVVRLVDDFSLMLCLMHKNRLKMKKPTYKYPDFVSKVELKSGNGKRYWLNLEIDKNKLDRITVILKNPSRADEMISDKTVFNVSNYIYKNRVKNSELKNVGQITILNLIPNN